MYFFLTLSYTHIVPSKSLQGIKSPSNVVWSFAYNFKFLKYIGASLECAELLNMCIFPDEDAKGKEVFWHSSAHILGAALERLYEAKLTHGPVTENGFFYDS